MQSKSNGRGTSEQSPEHKADSQLEPDRSEQFTQFSKAFLEAAPYYLVQSPLNGLTQLIDHTSGTKLLPKVQIFDAPKPAKIGTAAYSGEVAAGAAATIIPMLILHKRLGPGAAAKLELTSQYGLTKAAVPKILQSAGLGAVYGSVLTPSDLAENFYKERLTNGVVSALSLATLTSGSIGLKASGSKLLKNDLVSTGLSGALSGTVSADGHSLLRGQGLSTKEARLKSVISYSVGGIASGAANSARELLAPTSGIRGVRTLSDMTKRADSTMAANPPKRFEFIDRQNIPPKAEHLNEAHSHHWYNRSSKNLREYIDESTMPLEWRKQVVSGHQDLTYGLEAVHNRSNPKPIIVVYGSARFKENDFRYQRARYIGGRAAQEGYDVMTGGGPGTMEAANRGAYEAGGGSIGIILKLPHEKQGNGYQTVTIPHRNFYTRMENLKKGDVFIVEDGGVGTAAEALDTITHIQTGKMKGLPVYFIGKEKHRYLEKFLSQMEKDGTISPSDRKLYKIVDDPDQVFADLRKRKQASK
jgi:uncharacterized protein (TIGR00730 family)